MSAKKAATGKKLRLGIWGLGRGLSFYQSCAALNIDVVAGCDYNEHMRARFLEQNSRAFATSDAAEFLRRDMDAVLVATFCPAHAGDAIACLEAAKHVLSEVTAFHTMAEGVALADAVEKSGLVYNLAENYPFSKPMMFLAGRWREGLFGELMYAECEYVHECRSLVYTYIDGVPIAPGSTVHNWRSWIHFHYYNTHSLGPVLLLEGARPTRVVSLPGHKRLAGYLVKSEKGMSGIAPSLIAFDSGAVMRNLMGATTNDAHIQRFWGTRGAAEFVDGELRFRLGAAGQGLKLPVEPAWPDMGALAEATGHGGGDFWTLYYFARQIRTGEPAPFDVYTAADCTIPGILAYRSTCENGVPQHVPDFRDKRERAKYRNDHFAQRRYNVARGCFPKGADFALTGRFSTIMRDLVHHATTYRAAADWLTAARDTKETGRVLECVDRAIAGYPGMLAVLRAARALADAYPRSDGAQVLREMLELADEPRTTAPGFIRQFRKERETLARKQR